MDGKINNEQYREMNTALKAELSAEKLIPAFNELSHMVPYKVTDMQGLVWCKHVNNIGLQAAAIYERACADMLNCGHDMGGLTDRMWKEEMANALATNPQATYTLFQMENELGLPHAMYVEDEELLEELNREDNMDMAACMLKKTKESELERLMRKLGLCEDDEDEDDEEDEIPCVVTEDDGTESEYTIVDEE